jgi:hypothetical protein
MSKVSVSLDLSFVEPALRYMVSPCEAALDELVAHDAARGIYAHAVRFGNAGTDIGGFWAGLLSRASADPAYAARVRRNIKHMEGLDMSEAYRELSEHLPRGTDLDCRLFGEVGYDIGVVSEGDAYLNLGHPHFADTGELVFFAVHELHHVGYTIYNPLYTLDDVKTTRDLEHAVRYSTHIEGTAVYAPYELREREGRFGHVDYELYRDTARREGILKEFFTLLGSIEAEPERALAGDDLGVLSRLSGGRLWYVSGLHMAKTIDEALGREALTGTIVDGPESFFRVYDECSPQSAYMSR